MAFFCVSCMLANAAFAQVPRTISYQAVLSDGLGMTVADGSYELHFALYDGASGGTALWTETQTLTVRSGVFFAALGSVEPFGDLGFDVPYFLGVTVENEDELAPRVPLTASAYSLSASAVAGETNVVPSSGPVGFGTTAPNAEAALEVVGPLMLVAPGGTSTPDANGKAQINHTSLFGTPSGFQVQNTNGSDATVSVITYESFTGTATISSDQSIAAVANEVNIQNSSGQSYASFNESEATVSLPTIFQNFTSFQSGMMVQNASGNSTDIAVEFVGSAQVSGTTTSNLGIFVPTDVTDVAASITPQDCFASKSGGTFFLAHVNCTGDAFFSGSVSKGSGTFKIDHPLDPANKYLSHSFVESPDMMNVYNGNVRLDDDGAAWIELPTYFEALNRDFRYQLTAIGAPGPNLYVAEEIDRNRFRIAGGAPGMKVSWQVTGVRQDPYAEMNRVQVETDKPETERGRYLHPEAYGMAQDQRVQRPLAPAPSEATTTGGTQ